METKREQVERLLGRAGLGIAVSDPKHTYFAPRGTGRLGVMIRLGGRGLRVVQRFKRAGRIEDQLVSPEVYFDRLDWSWLCAFAESFARRATAQQRATPEVGESAQAW